MDNYEENYLNRRPQDLCKMCGKCCKVVTTPVPYEELLEKAKNNDKAAKDFLDIFVPFDSIEAAREKDASIVDNIIDTMKSDNPDFSPEGMTFYTCKYLGKDNKCTNYEERPALCRRFPATPWAITPPDCGFEGWLFWKREEIKEKIRHEKEELLELKLLKTRNVNQQIMERIQVVENKIHKNIDLYKKYGSEFW